MSTKWVSRGLAAARMEGVCLLKHAAYLKNRGYRFCPWCGMKLQIRHHCDHCKRDFLSDASFEMHKFDLERFTNNPCPNQAKDKLNHLWRYMKRRQMFYCATCRIEYPEKSQ